MPSTRRSLLAGCGAAAVLGFLGCNRSNPRGTPASSAKTAEATEPFSRVLKLALVTNGPADFWRIASAGVHKYEAEAKVQVQIEVPAGGSADEQNRILENLASQDYDAVAVSPVAAYDQVPILNKVAASSKLITVDSDAPTSKRLLYVGTNNYAAGKALGEQIVKLLPKGSKMAVLVGSLAADNTQQRLQGILDTITPAGIELVDKREDKTDRAKARSNVEDVLNAHRDLSLVAGLYSYNGPAIAAALRSLSGKKGTVHAAVFDEEAATLSGIAEGVIDFTVVQKPFMFGYLVHRM